MVQFSHPYMTNGKTIALTIQTFVSKVLFLILQIFRNGWVLTLQFINIICRGVKVGWKFKALSSLLELIWQQVFHKLIPQLFNQSTKRLECMAPRTSHPQQVKILHPWKASSSSKIPCALKKFCNSNWLILSSTSSIISYF